MDFLVQDIIPYLLAYKYVTLFIIAFSAAFIIPIPSGSVLMAAAAFASEGYLNFSLIIIISIIGNILGDNLSYWAARTYGEKILSSIGFRKILKSKTFNLIKYKFQDSPGFVVLASRFEVLSTLSINILAGIGKVPYKKYLYFESIGTTLQVCFYSSIGYIFAYNLEYIDTLMGKISFIVIIILIFLFFNFKNKIVKNLKKH